MKLGIAPFVKEQMTRDFKLQPFSFTFDETNTSQVKKDVQFWSSAKKKIVNWWLYH